MHRDAESLPARGFLSGGRRYKTDPVIAVCAIYQSIIRRREGICQGPRGTLIGNLQAPPCSIPSCIAKTATNLRLVAAPFVQRTVKIDIFGFGVKGSTAYKIEPSYWMPASCAGLIFSSGKSFRHHTLSLSIKYETTSTYCFKRDLRNMRFPAR